MAARDTPTYKELVSSGRKATLADILKMAAEDTELDDGAFGAIAEAVGLTPEQP